MKRPPPTTKPSSGSVVGRSSWSAVPEPFSIQGPTVVQDAADDTLYHVTVPVHAPLRAPSFWQAVWLAWLVLCRRTFHYSSEVSFKLRVKGGFTTSTAPITLEDGTPARGLSIKTHTTVEYLNR